MSSALTETDKECPIFELNRLHSMYSARKLHSESSKNYKCGPIPSVMAALPNIRGALCSTPQSLLTPTTRVPCSNAAKTRKPLKFAGVPQTTGSISGDSGPKFTILWGYVEEILMLNKFFSEATPCVEVWP